MNGERAGIKPFGSVLLPPPPPLCGIVVQSSWHDPVACAFRPGHDGPHSWSSIPALPPSFPSYGRSRMTKQEAAQRLAIVAGEIRLTLDESDDGVPSWPDDLDSIADALHPGGAA